MIIGVALGWWVHGGQPLDESTEHMHDEVAYRCPMHPTVVSEVPGSCPICAMDLVADEQPSQPETSEREISHWRAPMDANYTAAGPGKSPMGMSLIPVYVDELGTGSTVTIDAATMQNMGVRTAVTERRVLQRTVRTVGRVDYDETRMSDVNTKVSGWVEKLHVDFTGQHVETGQPLLEIYSPELVNAQEEHLISLDYLHRLQRQRVSDDVLEGARQLVEASTQRLRFLDVSQERIQRLESEGVVERTVMIESPQQGVVVHKAVLEGAYIRPGEHLYRIADLSSVWIYADLFERDIPWVKEGAAAVVSLSFLPDRVFQGTVAHLFPFLDADTRSLRARLTFDNADGQLKPAMYADVVIDAAAVPDVIVAPVQAILHTGTRRVAIVHLGAGKFQPRQVEVGVEADGWYEIRSGLRVGDEIVTSAQFLIDSESNLKTAVSNMRSAGDTQPTAVGG
jgi:Cu(I)/Ag(I) efflux system membrane fusion protein/cobalt-zinc-cadmium efflux system membrane fusion protein